MSFGEHEYQHRYYNNSSKGKSMVGVDNTTHVGYPHERIHRSLNPTYFDHLAYRDPSIYDSYNDYLYNSIVLNSFKRNADYYRLNKKFGTFNPYYDYVPPIRRVVTQPPYVQPVIVPNSPSVLYINKENPEALAHVHKHNAMLINRISEVEKEKMKIQAQAAKQKQQVKQYRRKYDKLKNRLRSELNHRKLQQAQLRQRKYIELQKERLKMNQIENAMQEMKEKIVNNSKIFQQNLKLKHQLQNTQLQKSRMVLFPTIPNVLTRSMIVDHPKLDNQYKEMSRLKSQIKQLDKKLGYYRQ